MHGSGDFSHLLLQDINDVTPVFERDLYEAVIPENAPGGTSVITVPATDTDRYACVFVRVCVCSYVCDVGSACTCA